jgi:hypothetical protein
LQRAACENDGDSRDAEIFIGFDDHQHLPGWWSCRCSRWTGEHEDPRAGLAESCGALSVALTRARRYHWSPYRRAMHHRGRGTTASDVAIDRGLDASIRNSTSANRHRAGRAEKIICGTDPARRAASVPASYCSSRRAVPVQVPVAASPAAVPVGSQ